MQPSGPHPLNTQLRAYLLGHLDNTESEVIERHLNRCEDCVGRLAQQDERDSMVELIRQGERQAVEDLIPIPGIKMVCPTTFPGYELGKEIGRGGMGVVYKAIHKPLNRVVAIKTLLPGVPIRTEVLKRFEVEAMALARLHHPNIVQVFEVGEVAGNLFVALEYVSGCSLDEHLRREELSTRDSAALAQTLATAIHFAHQRGVLHRDLKPSNVLVDATLKPKIVDFGVAKLMEVEGESTLPGIVLGTPAYMAPEQADGSHEVHIATDVYGIGAILYRCITGHAPFTGATSADVVRGMRENTPARPRSIDAKIPIDLETIVMKCLEREESSRYDSALELAHDLQRFLDGRPIMARPVPSHELVWRWAKRNPALTCLTMMILVGLVGTAITATTLWQRAERARSDSEEYRRDLELAVIDATAARDGAHRNLYANQISNAWSQYLLGNLFDVRNFLKDTSPVLPTPELRSWEWSFIKQMCDSEMIRLAPHHRTVVHSVAVSHSGKLVASGHGVFGAASKPTAPAVVILRELNTGNVIGELDSLVGRIGRLSFSPNDELLAVASSDGNLTIWDTTTLASASKDERELNFVAKFDGIDADTSLLFSEDAKLIAFRTQQDELIIYDLDQLESRMTIRHRDVGVFDIGWKAERIWSVADSTMVTQNLQGETLSHVTIKKRAHRNSHFRFGASLGGGRFAARDSRGNVHLVDELGAPVLLDGNSQGCSALAAGPIGRMLAIGRTSGELQVWDVKSMELIYRNQSHASPITDLAFHPDGSMVISASMDGTVRTWDLTRPAIVNYLSLPRAFCIDIAMKRDCKTLVLAGPRGVLHVDPVSGDVLKHWFHTVVGPRHWPRNDFKVSPDARWFVAPNWNHRKRLDVVDVDSGKVACTLPVVHGEVRAFGWSPSGSALAVAVVDRDRTHRVDVWNVSDGNSETLATFRGKGIPISVALSDDDAKLAFATTKPNRVRVYDLATKQLLYEFTDVGTCFDLAFQPNGDRLAVADRSKNSWHSWNLVTGKRDFEPIATLQSPTSIAFSPDGNRIVVSGQSAQVQLYEAQTGNPLILLDGDGPNTGTRGWTPKVLFSHDGKSIVAKHLKVGVNIWSIPRSSNHPYPQLQSEHSQRRAMWHLTRGKRVIQSGKEDANFHFEKARTERHPNIEYGEKMSELARRLGHREEAIQYANQAVEESNNNPWLRFEAAIAHSVVGNWDIAMMHIHAADEMSWQPPPYFEVLRANCERNRGR